MPLPKPPGLLAAIVGAVIGGLAGVVVANSVFELIAVGDLSDLGSGLLLLGVCLIVGPSAGVTVALLVSRQEKAVATGLISVPLILAALALTFTLLDNIDQATDNSFASFVGAGLGLVLLVAAIWLARHLTASRR